MAVTTIEEVKFAGGLSNEFSDEEIESEIDLVEAEIYDRYFLPKRSQFVIDTDYVNYYIHTEKVHEIIRVQVSVDTTVDPSGYITLTSNLYSHTAPNNYITLDSSVLSTYDTKIIRVQFIPKVINLMATSLVALNLTDASVIVDGERSTPPFIIRLREKIKRYRMILKPKTIIKSTENQDFDKYDYISLTQSDFR